MKYVRLFEELAQPNREYYPSGRVQSEHWYLNDQQHREDGPAWIEYWPNGRVKVETWYLNDQRHREDGPAWIEYDKSGRGRSKA